VKLEQMDNQKELFEPRVKATISVQHAIPHLSGMNL